MLIQIIDEIKYSKKILLLGIGTCIAIMSIVVIFSNLTIYLMPKIYNNYDRQFKDGITVDIYGMQLDRVDFVKSLGITKLNISIAGSSHFDSASIIDESNDVEIKNKELVWFTEENCSEYYISPNINIEEFNESNNAIVYCSYKDMNNYEIGDVLSLELKNGKVINNYIILQVIECADMKEIKVIIPAKTTIAALDKAGYIMNYDVQAIYPKTEGYISLKKELAKKNIICKSDIDNVMTIVASLELVFKIMVVVFTVISVMVMVVLSIININTREKFLILQKVLGARNYRIICIYLAILELQIVVSDIVGSVIGYIYTNYLTDVLKELYSVAIGCSNVNLVWIILRGIIISNIAMIPFAFIIKKIISKKDIIATINNKD